MNLARDGPPRHLFFLRLKQVDMLYLIAVTIAVPLLTLSLSTRSLLLVVALEQLDPGQRLRFQPRLLKRQSQTVGAT